MDGEDILSRILIELPERVEKLEKTVFEQHFLISLLLSRSGLSEEKIESAFELGSSKCKGVLEQRSQQITREWLESAEGLEATKKAEVALAARQKELWREDCVEEGCIKPFPNREGFDDA